MEFSGFTTVSRKKVVLFNVIFEEGLVIFVRNEGKWSIFFSKFYIF